MGTPVGLSSPNITHELKPHGKGYSSRLGDIHSPPGEVEKLEPGVGMVQMVLRDCKDLSQPGIEGGHQLLLGHLHAHIGRVEMAVFMHKDLQDMAAST